MLCENVQLCVTVVYQNVCHTLRIRYLTFHTCGLEKWLESKFT